MDTEEQTFSSSPDDRSKNVTASSCFNAATHLLLIVSGGLVAWLVISITYSVISRRIFDIPAAWTLELSEYALLFITFLGLAAVTRDREHVVVTIITREHFPKFSWLCDLIGQMLGFVIAVMLFLISLYITWKNFDEGIRMTRILPIERWIVLSTIPVGSFFWAIELLFSLNRIWRDNPNSNTFSCDSRETDFD